MSGGGIFQTRQTTPHNHTLEEMMMKTATEKKSYEVNADGDGRSFNGSAREVARVAVDWKKQGHSPKAFAIESGEMIETREVEITTVNETAKRLKGE
jgi:plasmid stability protein